MTICIDVYRSVSDATKHNKAFGAQVEWNESVNFPFEKTIEVFKSILGGFAVVKFNIV